MRAAHAAACASLIALSFLCLAWELSLAPLRPGGSWLALKSVLLLGPLFGVLHGRPRAVGWALLLLMPAYFTEGVVRGWSEAGLPARLALAETALAVVFFVAGVACGRPRGRRRAAEISPIPLAPAKPRDHRDEYRYHDAGRQREVEKLPLALERAILDRHGITSRGRPPCRSSQ